MKSIEVTNCDHCPFAEYTSTETRESYYCSVLNETVKITSIFYIDRDLDDIPLPAECPLLNDEIIVKLKK